MDTEIRGHEITAGPGAHGEQPRAPFVPRGLLADTMPPASLPQSPHRNPGARPPVGVGVGCALLENVLLPRGYPTPSPPRRAAAPRVTGARISSPVSIFRVTGASCHPVPRLRVRTLPGIAWLGEPRLPTQTLVRPGLTRPCFPLSKGGVDGKSRFRQHCGNAHLPPRVCTLQKGTQKCSVTFAKPLNQIL